ncbi:PGF-CTERM sorting domain-containing protein [Methanocorpusculum sp. MG]|uniref:PGF-CTERM sorting domain-containing protein n=1 Tax=Methanocorpusculum petauri TaxID=3002863 RepID=A0ABT4IHQ2_9EURY|nr:MEMAR_RS02690 family S-layer glycoprotein [Methanocorpusculum petauri]MCZ0861265.1 PGF-CTERM sorting domain-containing protein [Methanocorpusculum petauri]
MKIMAVLAVLLISALFMGAASAAGPTQGDKAVNITYLNGSIDTPIPEGGLTVTVGEKVTFNVTKNASYAVDVDWTKITLNYTTTEGYWDEGKFIKSTFTGPSIAPFTFSEVGTYWIAAVNSTGPVFNSSIVKVIVKDVPAAKAYGPVFVNQEINSSTFGQSGPITLYKLSGDATPAVLDTIDVTDTPTRLYPEQVGSNTGVWYIGTPSNTGDYVAIWYPEISLKAELTTGADGKTSGDSIDGKTINKNTEVSFIIEAPKLGDANVGGAGKDGVAQAKIIFTTPVGGKTTTFGNGEFVGLNMSAVQNIALGKGVAAGQNTAAGTWMAQAEFTSPKSFSDYAEKSNSVTFTLQSTTLTITAAKDSVVRSNPFTVTIQGDSKTNYSVYIDSPATNEVNPTLQPGQSGFQSKFAPTGLTFDTNYKIDNGSIYYSTYSDAIGGVFQTDASGKRTVQFNTADNTEDKTYTIKVSGFDETEEEWDSSNYDKVKVKVEKGAVTIAASGDGSYYIGDEIKLTGTNTDSDTIFLFVTGQNLKQNGVILKALPEMREAYTAASGDTVAVKTDDTWEYKWDTTRIGVDTGAYTIYATSRLTNGKSSDPIVTTSPLGTAWDKSFGVGKTDDKIAVKLSDSEYATISVNLKQPFLSAIPSSTVIAQGDKLYITGTAQGKPSTLNMFIFGPNYFADESITVNDDGSYEKKFDIPSDLSSNQYFVVVQHPMYNGFFDVKLKDSEDGKYTYFYIDNATTGNLAGTQGSFIVKGQNKLQGSQAADALTKMIDDANIDDIYTKLTFTVAAPWIRINNPGDQAMGSKFTITGTTNLAVDDQILVEVMSSSFTAVDKTSTSTTSGVSQATKVVAGEGTDNTWSIEVDSTNWKLDEYTIKVNGIEVDVSTTTNFNLVEKVVTPTPTATSTGVTPTTTATATATATPSTPGFGAFIALAGLGAVALLVLRRN